MDQSEYITGFYGILIAFTLTELLKGIAQTVKNRHKIKYYCPHGLFALLAFLLVILNFFDFYYFLSTASVWTPLLLIQNSFPAIFLCFCTYILFPSFNEEAIDFREHYFKVTPIIFGIGVCVIILILFRNIFLQQFHPLILANILLFFLLAIFTVSIFLKKDWIQFILLIIANLIGVYWTLLFQIKSS